MKQIAIISPTGMLGSMVYNVLKDKYHLILLYREKEKLELLNKKYGSVKEHEKLQCDLMSLYEDYYQSFSHSKRSAMRKLMRVLKYADYVINCAGITKPHSMKNPTTTFFINGAIPHIFGEVFREKLIQITTDCVYDGISGAPYNENASKNPNDLYGLSKSLGEPKDTSLVIRTSIIGPEISGFQLFIEWFRKQKAGSIQGFINHYWNGITTKQFAKICDEIISQRSKYPKSGLFHVFSTSVSKYEMLLKFKEKYNSTVKINPTKSTKVDRRLATVNSFCTDLQIPSFEAMLKQL